LFLGDKKFFKVTPKLKQHLNDVKNNFSLDDAQQIKQIESVTNHDVKAVEYFLKEQLDKAGASNLKEWIHFGLTSQDINNTAIPLSWKDCMEHEYLPEVVNTHNALQNLAKQWNKISMLARTHGQPASPTVLGKEIMVFTERIYGQIKLFTAVPYAAKFGGATGNFNAHHIAFPKKNWIDLGNEFVNNVLGLERMQFTTQIEHKHHFN
jgi:adenylosuccinate lyase